MVAMVDVLERMDEQLYNEYRGIMAMLKQTIEDVHKFQDEETGMFWQVMDHPGVEGNYLETSGTALFAYAVLKGVRLGYLPKRMAAWAEKAFYGTCDKYLSKNPDGSLQLDGICLVAGLGGKDHRDGSLRAGGLQRCQGCRPAGAGLHRNDRTQVNCISWAGSFLAGHESGHSIARRAVAKQRLFKMLKTAAFTVQNGQNAENSKADLKKKMR
jgi:hypothetical protein